MADNVELIPTTQVKELGYKFENLNPFQSLFYREYDHQSNAVCSAPTGSGKTVVAEIATSKVLCEGKRAIFLAPMRSLCLEKFDDWSAESHSFSEYGVSIMTGDFQLSKSKQEELTRSKVIVMTSEMLDSRSRRMGIEKNKWLVETDLLIVDEAHIIGMWNDGAQPLQERGHKLEAALMRFSKLNPNAKIILLSATLPNLPQLGEWLTKLNGKQTKIIVSDYKPQPVDWHMEVYPEQMGYGGYQVNKARMRELALDILNQNFDDMWLVFVHSKTDGKALQKAYQNKFGKEIPFHSADLNKDERIEIEKGFKSKKQPHIIATSTLAYGMNLPARRVMICDDKRGLNDVHVYDIKQMGGRAGRPGIDPRGDVHCIIGDRSRRKFEISIANMPPAKSLMEDVDTFAFHIVAEIAEGGICDLGGIKEFYDRCLSHFQGVHVDDMWLRKLLDKLIECKVVKPKNSNANLLQVTPLGKIASWLYFSPFDVFHWYDNMHRLVQSNRKDDAALAWMWGSIRGNSMEYVPKGIAEEADDLRVALKDIGSIKGCETACVGLWLRLKGVQDKDLPPDVYPMLRGLIGDVNRHLQAISLIDQMYGRWGKANALKMLSIRLQYGCGWEAASLCTLDGIGKVRAENLINGGITKPEDLQKYPKRCKKILGEAIYHKAVESLEYAINPTDFGDEFKGDEIE